MTQPDQLIKIGIHGVPRSGTSWLGQILNSSPQVLYKFQPLFSYELKGFLNEQSTRTDIDRFFDLLQSTRSVFLDQTDQIQKGIVPAFSKEPITHVVYKEVRYHHLLEQMLTVHPGIRIVGIIRNPLAVLASWFASPREFRRDLGWLEKEEWRFAHKKNEGRAEEFFGYEKWKETALIFGHLANKFPDRFYLLRYSDLLMNTDTEISKLFRFCGLDVGHQTESFIKNSRSVAMNDAYAVFKLKQTDDTWKQSLDDRIVQSVREDLAQSPLYKYLES